MNHCTEPNKAAPSESEVLEEAYLYAYPLVLMDVIKDMTINTIQPTPERAPLNQIFHAHDLATPEVISLTRPNVDTVYSQAYFDLDNEPILLRKPATSRYCTIQTFDGYSNTPFILGTDGLGGNDEAVYAFTGPFWKGALPEEVIEVPMPTNFVWLLIRTKCFGRSDLDEVYSVQEGMRTYPLSAHDASHGANYQHAPGTYNPAFDYVPLEILAAMPTQDFFDRFNSLTEKNPGAPEDAPALARFKELGIGAGKTFKLAALSDEAIQKTASLPTLLNRDFSSKHAGITVSNGWMFMDNRVGNFGTDYAFRAVVAFGGFANPVSMAVYPSMVMDAQGAPLCGDKRYLLHFEPGMTPPHGENGWWSLTAYTEEGHLIPNELARYNLGEVNDLPFNEDGPLDLYLQTENPGSEKEATWVPLCEGIFSLTMRIYLPTPEVLSFAWELPPLEVQE